MATAGCLVPAVGFARCAAFQAGALAVRMQQRAQEGGGWNKTWRANAGDAALTLLPLGMVRAPISFVKTGQLGWISKAIHPRMGNPGQTTRITEAWQETFGESMLKFWKLTPGQLGRSLLVSGATFVPSYGLTEKLGGGA